MGVSKNMKFVKTLVEDVNKRGEFLKIIGIEGNVI